MSVPAQPDRPSLAVAVCTHRRRSGLHEVLGSLDDQSEPPQVVYVLDNDPEGSARSAARPNGGPLVYVSMGENAGPAGAFSRALELAQDDVDGPDWVTLVGDDNPLPTADVLAAIADLIQRVSVDEDVAAVGLNGARFSRTRGTSRLLDDELDGVVDVDFVTGGGRPTYNVRALRRLGVEFDATLFFGFEELDVGMGIRRAGGRVVVDGDWLRQARARAGKLGRPLPRVQPRRRARWRTYYSVRNHLIVSWRHSRPLGRVRAVGLGGAMVLSRVLDRRRWSDVAPAALGFVHWALGVRGRVLEPSAAVEPSASGRSAGAEAEPR